MKRIVTVHESCEEDSKSNQLQPGESNPDRLLFFDMVRNIGVVSVIFYHAVAAYSTATPHWSVHDGTSVMADGVRHLFDVFIMPVFFFVAGYFALSSLTKQGAWGFLKGKARRIGIPWLIAVLIVVPMVRYFGEMKAAAGPALPFWRYWAAYVAGFGTFRMGPASVELMSQMHFWFLSLLLAFFVIMALTYSFMGGRFGISRETPFRRAPSGMFVSITLPCIAVGTSIVYFIVGRVVPEASWINIDLLLQFQPASLVLYAACFVLGLSACYGQWFAKEGLPGKLLLLAPICLLLTAAFFAVGREIFANPLTSNELPAGRLLSFSFIRTFLCLALLAFIVAYARKGWNRPSALNGRLAANSYNIYLCHLFFVVFLQDVLMVWRGGPAMAKAFIVLLAVLPISYGVSRVMGRFPRAFSIGLVALFAFILLIRR